MSSTFSPPSYLSLTFADPAVHWDGSRASSSPFLPPPCTDSWRGPLRGPGSGLLPHRPFRLWECPFEPALIQKRNERERQRVRCVNQGYTKLRSHLPAQDQDQDQDKRLSKVETLRAAIRYIKYLQGLVDMENPRITSLSAGTDVGRGSENSSAPEPGSS